MWCRNHPNDPPEQLDVAEMTNVFATNVGGTCAATQVTNQQHFHLLPSFILKQTKIILRRKRNLRNSKDAMCQKEQRHLVEVAMRSRADAR